MTSNFNVQKYVRFLTLRENCADILSLGSGSFLMVYDSFFTIYHFCSLTSSVMKWNVFYVYLDQKSEVYCITWLQVHVGIDFLHMLGYN